jgi:hypothetical protein
MKYGKLRVYSLVFFLTTIVTGPVLAEDFQHSGFLSDYSHLKSSSDKYMDYKYLVSGAPNKIAKYSAIMIDQPEIFISPDSKYKGMKPDDMKELADLFRGAMARSLSEGYMIVDQPGPNVLYVRFALSNLKLKKKKRGLLSYTPVGLVATAAKEVLLSDLTKKIDLKGLTMEMEILDSTSEEQLAASVEVRSGSKENPASWSELEALIDVYSQRVRCKLDNTRLAEKNRLDCMAGG